MKILVIEDEPAMLDTMVQSLEQEKYVVESATHFDEALERTGIYEYDCILLDIGLPGGDGLELLRELKKQNKTDGVIIVSAKNSLDDKIEGLNLGADDYLAKPFHLAELHARVKSVIRRRRFKGNHTIVYHNLEVDPEQRIASVDNVSVSLNRKEFDILVYLLMNKNRLVTKTAMAEHVWGDQVDEANSLDFIYSQIRNVRKKLKESGADLEIESVYGTGYKLAAE